MRLVLQSTEWNSITKHISAPSLCSVWPGWQPALWHLSEGSLAVRNPPPLLSTTDARSHT